MPQGPAVVALRPPRQYRALRRRRGEAIGPGRQGKKGGTTVASKDKGGGKASKKPAQHDLKAKRKAKKEKRASK
jgi:hypothetical protein